MPSACQETAFLAIKFLKGLAVPVAPVGAMKIPVTERQTRRLTTADERVSVGVE